MVVLYNETSNRSWKGMFLEKLTLENKITRQKGFFTIKIVSGGLVSLLPIFKASRSEAVDKCIFEQTNQYNLQQLFIYFKTCKCNYRVIDKQDASYRVAALYFIYFLTDFPEGQGKDIGSSQAANLNLIIQLCHQKIHNLVHLLLQLVIFQIIQHNCSKQKQG